MYLTSSELSVVFDSRLRVPISYATLPFLTMGQIAEESRITVFRRTHFCYWRVPSTRSEPWIQSLLVSFEGLGLREILNRTPHSLLSTYSDFLIYFYFVFVDIGFGGFSQGSSEVTSTYYRKLVIPPGQLSML